MKGFSKPRQGLAILAVAALLLGGCATVPDSQMDREQLRDRADMAVAAFKQSDPSLQERFFDRSVGYAVFPGVGKGGMGVGAAFGRGVLYQGGRAVGFSSLTQASIGFQFGGQAYKEIIFFQTPAALAEFKAGDLAFSAQVSAVAAEAGAAATARYRNGVAVFIHDSAGLMYEASVGGQKFEFVPLDQVE